MPLLRGRKRRATEDPSPSESSGSEEDVPRRPLQRQRQQQSQAQSQAQAQAQSQAQSQQQQRRRRPAPAAAAATSAAVNGDGNGHARLGQSVRRGGGGGGQGRAAAREQEQEAEYHDGDDDDGEDGDGGAAAGGASQAGGDGAESQQAASTEQMVGKLVRLALACEFSRQPIRRADIVAKVLGPNGRRFREIFAKAQAELKQTFGMQMEEQPLREKVTLSQRRAAQRAERAAASSNAWSLKSTLPEAYRVHKDILAPPKVPTARIEATYIGLYSFILALVGLSGGSIAEARLERYLQRANAEQYTPLDKTDKLLQRMCKEGYLVRVKDASCGEETVEYMAGARAKVEVGAEGVAGLVRTVYGGGDVDVADLDARLERSLGLKEKRAPRRNDAQDAEAAEDGTGSADAAAAAGPARGGTQRRTTRAMANGGRSRNAPGSDDEDEGEAEEEDDDD